MNYCNAKVLFLMLDEKLLRTSVLEDKTLKDLVLRQFDVKELVQHFRN